MHRRPTFRIRHSSLVTRHSSLPIRHSSLVTRHSPFCILHSALCIAFSALAAAADAITWEGTTNLAMTAATTVDVPAGTTSRIDVLSGAYALTKTGGGTLEIRYVKTASASVTVAEGTVHFTNPRPDAIFAQAAFHVDATHAASMTIVEENGTNFVTRWNDTDGGTRYATPCADTKNGRVPERLPFIGQGTQNGLPYVDFGSLAVGGYTNADGVAIGHGAALIWNSGVNYHEGFTVVSDTPDIATLPSVPQFSSSWYAMSFFSRHNGTSGYRGSLYPDHLPYLYKDNASNNAVTINGASNWVDSVYQSAPRKSNALPAGFHVFNCSTPNGGLANAFGKAANTSSGSNTSYGGTRIGEYAVFENQLSASERSEMTGFLLAKWLPVRLASITVGQGASLAIDDDVKVAAAIADNGARSLALGSQTVVFDKGLSALGAAIHLDASRTDTMTIVFEGGTNFVTRWNDADGGDLYAVHEAQRTGAYGQRPNPDARKPFLSPDVTQNGLPVVDLGTAIFSNYTNSEGVAYGYGASFQYNKGNKLSSASIREYIAVIADREDLKDSPAGLDGPSYVAYWTGNSNSGQNQGRRGLTAKGRNPALFYNVTSATLAPFSNGTLLVDGVERAYSFCPPDGFSVMDFQTASAVSCNLIGRTLRGDTKMVHDTFGGQRIAEYMVFTELVDDAKRQRIYNALRNKWFGDPPATTNFYGALSLGAAASLTVKYEAVAATNELSLAGALAAPEVFAANMAVVGTNATVAGALTLADGATLSFERLQDGTWTSLSATSLAAEGAVSVSLSGNPKGLGGKSVRLVATDNPPASLDGWRADFSSDRITARPALRDGGVWVDFFSVGTILFVR